MGTYAACDYIFVIADSALARMVRKIANFSISSTFPECVDIGFIGFLVYRRPSFRRLE